METVNREDAVMVGIFFIAGLASLAIYGWAVKLDDEFWETVRGIAGDFDRCKGPR